MSRAGVGAGTVMESLENGLSWDTSGGMVRMAAQMRTPRPNPQFFKQPQTFSTKKERATPRDAQPPPRPPVKSAPPVSRIFPHKIFDRAQPVSFKSSENLLASRHYNEGIRDLYFDQCFEMEEKIGIGSFGEVFKVRSREDGQLYAVKRSRERFRGESDRKRKLEEVAKHEQLPKHPNCVKLVKAWEERQHLYLQTELCVTNLSRLAEDNHNMPEKLIWNYLVDLLMAVKHLHDHELVHMDIKPDNIFISDIDTCKLGDFGLVVDISKGVDLSEAQEGDPRYLAPELMAGQFGKPADVFSLGITILELASDLDLPRGGELWHQLRSGFLPKEELFGVSAELQQIIQWMMTSHPDARPTVDQILSSPELVKIWSRRKREHRIRVCVSLMKGMMGLLLGVLTTLWLTITYPLQGLLPPRTSTPQKSDMPRHPPDWDHSFSDDDPYDEEINISNNSMGVPLNYSTSSEESNHDGFVVPSLPVRRAQTTPGYRSRLAFRTDTPASSGSPVLSSYSSRVSSSPLMSPSFRDDESFTPNSSFGRSVLEDEPAKLGIEPKNLMEAFEIASSEDD